MSVVSGPVHTLRRTRAVEIQPFTAESIIIRLEFQNNMKLLKKHQQHGLEPWSPFA